MFEVMSWGEVVAKFTSYSRMMSWLLKNESATVGYNVRFIGDDGYELFV